jgi:Proteins of 100 residues with WXG
MPDDMFMVDLAELGGAIPQVSNQRDAIQTGSTRTKATFNNIEDHWKSPSGTSFATLATQFNAVSDELVALVDEGIGRMRTAHTNYLNTEGVNTRNYE